MFRNSASMPQTQYICPGETHAITRAVHLARLAAFYPACRDCPFNGDFGALPVKTLAEGRQRPSRGRRAWRWTDDGVRGKYLNALDRTEAARITAVFSALLWERSPRLIGQDAMRSPARPARPAVVVGRDERCSSLPIASGVVTALRRAGCHVVDIGPASYPCFLFAIEHLRTQGGVLVTGAGCYPAWTGLDFALAGGIPLSGENGLREVEHRLETHASRPARAAGSYRSFHARVPYEAGLLKHFHALRPLRVCCGCPCRLVRTTLVRLLQPQACRLEWVETPCRARDITDPDDPDVRRLVEAVRNRQAHLGILIDDDGCRCGFVDENGRLLPPDQIAALIARTVLGEAPGGTVVVEPSAPPRVTAAVTRAGGRAVPGGASRAAAALAMREHGAVFGCCGAGRFWFADPHPACDAVITLARVLAALSGSSAAFSQIAGPDFTPPE